MNKKTIKYYLETIRFLMEQGKFIDAFNQLDFVIRNIEEKKEVKQLSGGEMKCAYPNCNRKAEVTYHKRNM